MDKKTKAFWWTMGFLILISFLATFYRYVIKKDYMMQAQVDCDPYNEACFIWNCDPGSEIEGEACTGDPEVDTWYYKIINKKANQISSCDVNAEECEPLFCGENEPDCEFVFCNDENKEENGSENCINPVDYTVANPIEEICEEGDIVCELGEITEEEAVEQTTEDVILSENEGLKEEVVSDEGSLPVLE
jgi:hypothetical protein